MITFGAKFLSSAQVEKINFFNQWKEKKVSCVELLPEDKYDTAALKTLAYSWKSNDAKKMHTYACDIYHDFCLAAGKTSRFFALTRQKSEFEKLNPEKILGLAETDYYEKNVEEIMYLQGNPEYNYENIFRNIKNTGKVLLNFVMSQFPNQNITLLPTPKSRPFYLKYGFKERRFTSRLDFFRDSQSYPQDKS